MGLSILLRSLGLCSCKRIYCREALIRCLVLLSGKESTCLQSLGQEYPLEKEGNPFQCLLCGKSHGEKSLVGYKNPRGSQESDTI